MSWGVKFLPSSGWICVPLIAFHYHVGESTENRILLLYLVELFNCVLTKYLLEKPAVFLAQLLAKVIRNRD